MLQLWSHQVSLSSLLQGEDCRALKAKIGLEVLGDLAHQALEGELTDEELRGLLVAADLAQRNRAGPVPVVRRSNRIHPERPIEGGGGG